MPTATELRAGKGLIIAVAETVRECRETPSGVLYAALCGKVSYEGYQKILRILQGAQLIEVTTSHLVRWVGPR